MPSSGFLAQGLVQHSGRSVVGCRSPVLDEQDAAWESRLHRLEQHLLYELFEEQALQQGHPVRSGSSGRIGPAVVEAAGCIWAAAEAGAGSVLVCAVVAVGGVGVAVDAVLLRNHSTVAVVEVADGAVAILGLVVSMDEFSEIVKYLIHLVCLYAQSHT